ncbi:hypothetical protein AAV35_000420 [Salimicrobium jeotgali]|uniref:Sigma-O factor regulatory protein RsoA n=1 Tax=Salimicrobium jeotgali TaxID=1230341 RepID=K2H4L4_9BACI|nr:hypothetical protein [Salimicrobium jeotgali]AKG03396.1 hypothetical protein AAV35_000420 [Salimicrobium jeotgali]EKE30820.1 hypothetical protein MJ3_11575 [Salimicrobium jeotgali]MBM7697685.1 threonine dehydratase [Salimicrobium jeotgali]
MCDCLRKEKKFNEVVNDFEPKIKKVLINTPFQEREDLEQELKMKIYQKIETLDEIEAPGFVEFLHELT